MFNLTIQHWIGISAGVLAIGGYVPYIISILRDKTRPERATWIIWTIVGGLLAISYTVSGDTKAIWVPLGYFFGPLMVMLLSFRYGYSKWSTLDSICLLAALLTIVPWYLSHNAIITLLLNVLIDSFGAIPTLIKTYKEPETEDLTAWFIFFLANTFELLAISQWDLSSSYPIYLFILASSMTIFILKGKFLRRS